MTALPSLIVITDWSLGRELLLERLGAALRASPRVAVQHRHPEAGGRAFLEEARLLKQLCDETGNPLFVNGRLDVALRVGAHLHLPAHGFTPAEARPHLPRDRWIAAAVHDEQELAASQGADLVLVSPVFAAGSKPGDPRPTLGIDGFDALALRSPVPAYALGGIDETTAPALPGARGFAVISAVLRAPDPQRATVRLLARGRTLLA